MPSDVSYLPMGKDFTNMQTLRQNKRFVLIGLFSVLCLLMIGSYLRRGDEYDLRKGSTAYDGPPTRLKAASKPLEFPITAPENRAVVSSLYDDSYGLALRVLGYSLDQAKVEARRIVIYIPGHVAPRVLCEVKASGWELRPVERIPPPKEGTAEQFRDQYTKLKLFSMTDLEALIYLDADTIVLRNFDELWQLPTRFAASPDIYLDERGFTLGINAGVLFVRPREGVLEDMLAKANGLRYEPAQAEQAFLNAYYFDSMFRLPYKYNGNLAIKQANGQMWQALKPTMAVIHYTLHKPHRNSENFQQGQMFEEEFKFWWDTRKKMDAAAHTWAPDILKC